jgi:hypothetical protein
MEADKIPHRDIERYVLGEMERAESLAFEQQMVDNVNLSQEVSFQSQVIKGIGEARKTELKARLAQIPVSTSPIGTLLNSAWVKAVSGVVVVSTASVLTYMQVQEDDANPADQVFIEVVDAPKENVEADLILPEKLEKLEAQSTDVLNLNTQRAINVVEDGDVVNMDADEELEINVPEVVVPEFDEEEPDTDSQSQELPTILETTKTASFSIEQYPGDRLYRYFDGELTLRGDFEQVTYELLELNNQAGKQYFIQIENIYYALPITDSFSSFQKIDNKKLIRELERLKSSN